MTRLATIVIRLLQGCTRANDRHTTQANAGRRLTVHALTPPAPDPCALNSAHGSAHHSIFG